MPEEEVSVWYFPWAGGMVSQVSEESASRLAPKYENTIYFFAELTTPQPRETVYTYDDGEDDRD